ncbi:hypothetical protein IFT66_14715 [Rhizobium sp. CFBP 13726]|uniref:hypothetical protein n=1 Tax=Rhizobium sp. CFBP 13726 TaxID=2775296 RepID=UPI0017869205|nr:hypothetical protein [Rhizobium sp. CFBP 13726]MBD8652338.1 hypothetical protein [Rhizobium sp. CFBP 13726]
MQGSHITKNRKSSTLSRRNFISIAAASTAATLPTVVLAEVSEKMDRLPKPSEPPIDHFNRLASEMSGVLNDYLDGDFFACVYPEKIHSGNEDLSGMVILKSLQRPPLEKRFEMALQSLCEVVQEMHPNADRIRRQVAVAEDSETFSVWIGAFYEEGGAA